MTSIVYGQLQTDIDTLMCQKKIRIVTQFECDSVGTNCMMILQKNYDTFGRLIRTEEYINNELYVSTIFSYNKFGKNDMKQGIMLRKLITNMAVLKYYLIHLTAAIEFSFLQVY